MARKKPKVDPSTFDAVEWQCAACDWAGRTGKEFLEHLTGSHGCTKEKIDRAKAQMYLHLDAAEYHSTTYTIDIDGERVGSKLVRVGRRRGGRLAQLRVKRGRARED